MNNQINQSNFRAGVSAGLITAALVLFALTFAATIPLFYLISSAMFVVPIYVVAFSNGTFSSITASVLAATCISFVLSFIFGAGFIEGASILVFLLVPACYAAWLLGLAQTNSETHETIWFPLKEVLFRLTIAFAVIGFVFGFIFYIQPELSQRIANAIAEGMEVYRSTGRFDDIQIIQSQNFIKNNYVLIAAVSATISHFFVGFLGLYLALSIARKLGKIKRKRDYWPRDLRMPVAAVVVFSIGLFIFITDINPLLKLLGATLSTSFALSFTLSGFAWAHYQTRAMPYRIFILGGFYILFLLIPPAILALGIWATFTKPNNAETSN